MQRLLVAHTNDVHGAVEPLTRVATVIDQLRAENPDAAVVYLDAGDVEETASRLSNLTKGAAMHRLLHAAGCRAAAVGNGAVLRYGVEVMTELAAAVPYPHLAANLFRDGRLVDGVAATTLLDVDGVRIGVIGLTPTDWPEIYEDVFGCERPPAADVVREHAPRLRVQGAEAVVVLSHIGLAEDRELAAQVQGFVDVIVGGHTHDLLTSGEHVGSVAIAQAGDFARHLGVVELHVDGAGAAVADVRVVDVPADALPHPRLVEEIGAIERELEVALAEVVGVLDEPLDFAYDRDCAAGAFMADVVRERLRADIAVVTASVAFDGPLPAGPLTRAALYEACSSSAVPAVTQMSGAQLSELVARGRDADFAAERPHSRRGRPRGLMHLSGAEMVDGVLLVAGEPVHPCRVYRVAGSDAELEPYGGYARKEWGLRVKYERPFAIMREAVEQHLSARRRPSASTR